MANIRSVARTMGTIILAQVSLLIVFNYPRLVRFQNDKYKHTADYYIWQGGEVKQGLVNTAQRASQPQEIQRFVGRGRASNTDKPFTVQPSVPCPDTMSAFLLILVGSPLGNRYKRDMIRKTWGAVKSHQGRSIKVIFYMGKSVTSIQKRELELESKLHNDVVQSHIGDGYYNLTLKNLEGFRWALLECPVARFVLKVDDDVFVLPKNAMDYLKTLNVRDEETLYQGYGLSANPPYRNKGHKWYVSNETYPNSTYPPYNLGFAVLFSMEVVKGIYEASFKAPSYFNIPRNFPFEDVFMGICAKYIGIVPKFVHGRFLRNPAHLFKAIEEDQCRALTVIATHDTGLGMFQNYLETSETVRKSNECPKKT